MSDAPPDRGDAGRSAPPFDEAAEQAVLGAILLDSRRAMRDVATTLRAEDFYRESHRAIYRAMLSLDEDNRPVDIVLLADRLRAMSALEIAGGGAYLSRLGASAPSVATIGHYATIVRDRALLRRLAAFARETADRANAGDVDDVGALVDDVAQQALHLAEAGTASSVVRLFEALEPAIKAAEKLAQSGNRGGITGVASGYPVLDKKTAGWQPSDLIILAARPGMGKTAFALNMLTNAARHRSGPTPGVIFSLEMSKEQLATRIWCATSRVPLENLRSGNISHDQFTQLYDGVVELRDLPIFIDDTGQITVAEMARKCRQLKHEHGIGMIMIDYLQLMGSSTANKNANREQQISEISRTLKGLAKELDVPIIALSQLNRGVEQRGDKRPVLSDLRESGAIEQDADIIVFLYRDAYYRAMGAGPGGRGDGPPDPTVNIAPVDPSEPSVTEVILAKHRSGSTGKVELLFHPRYTLFASLLPDGPPPPGDDQAPPYADRAPAPVPGYAPPPPDDDAPPPGDDDFVAATWEDDEDDAPF